MKLFATAEPNNSISRKLEVYDNNGLAHIKKVQPNGKLISWDSPNHSAAEWVALNNSYRNKWNWLDANGNIIPPETYY